MVYNNPATSNVDAGLGDARRDQPHPEFSSRKARWRQPACATSLPCAATGWRYSPACSATSAWLGNQLGRGVQQRRAAPVIEMFDAAAFGTIATRRCAARKLAPLLPWSAGRATSPAPRRRSGPDGHGYGPAAPARLPLPARDMPALAQVLQDIGLMSITRAAELEGDFLSWDAAPSSPPAPRCRRPRFYPTPPAAGRAQRVGEGRHADHVDQPDAATRAVRRQHRHAERHACRAFQGARRLCLQAEHVRVEFAAMIPGLAKRGGGT